MTHPDPFTARDRCLGFDSAPDGFAWSVVHRSPAGHYLYEDSGEFTKLTRSEIVREARYVYNQTAPTLLAVEGFGGYVSSARMARQRSNSLDISDLMQAAFVAGMLQASLPSPDQTVVLPSNGPDGDVKQWRYWLTGQWRQGDKGVALALDRVLDGGLPRRGKRKDGVPIYAISDHRRDATGLAVAAYLYRAHQGRR